MWKEFASCSPQSESHGERAGNFQAGSTPLHEEEFGRASHFGPEEMQHKEFGREKNVSQCSMLRSPWLSKGNFPMQTFHDACSLKSFQGETFQSLKRLLAIRFEAIGK